MERKDLSNAVTQLHAQDDTELMVAMMGEAHARLVASGADPAAAQALIKVRYERLVRLNSPITVDGLCGSA